MPQAHSNYILNPPTTLNAYKQTFAEIYLLPGLSSTLLSAAIRTFAVIYVS
jgi:hypothetical protein